MLPTLNAHAGLNSKQSQVLYSICASTHQNAPYVLHGPPGTGKTKVIAATVRCLLEMSPKVRVLLTAPSNMAADQLAYKLMDEFAFPYMHEKNVLRMRSIGNDFFNRDKKLDPISRL
jgi:helicase MOV-10